MNLKTLAAVAALALPSLATAQDIDVETVTGNQITIFGPSHVSVHTSIVIDAPVEVVWATWTCRGLMPLL